MKRTKYRIRESLKVAGNSEDYKVDSLFSFCLSPEL